MHHLPKTTAPSPARMSDDTTLVGAGPHVRRTDALRTDTQVGTQIGTQQTIRRGLLTVILLSVLAACTRDPETGTPVPNDPSVNEKGVDTVVKRQPMPQAEHAKEPPLGELDPRTGDPREDTTPVVRFNDAGHEAK